MGSSVVTGSNVGRASPLQVLHKKNMMWRLLQRRVGSSSSSSPAEDETSEEDEELEEKESE